MSFCSRLKHEKHKFRLFANEFKRCYTSNHVSNVANRYPSSRSLIPVANIRHLRTESSGVFFCKVRSYAAPVQFLQKKEEKETTSGLRLNDQITAQFVRLVTDEGHSVISRYDALARARSLNLDLVEVDGNSKPPACKMYDYKKEQYLQKVREKEHKKKLKSKGLKPGAHKEIRFAGKISKHDLQMKADMVKRLIESGHRVKCTAIEPTDAMDLETLLSRFSSLIEDVACKEGEPQIEKKQAFIVVRHLKFGPPKSGGKKASKTSTNESSKNDPSKEDEENTNDSPDEDIQTKKSEWAVFDESEDSTLVHDFEDEEVKVPTKNEQANAASSVPKQGIENRYTKVSRVVNERNTHQIPNQGKQPQFNVNPSHRVPNQIPNLGREDSSRPSIPNSPNKGFGIFSAQRENTQPNEQNAPAGSNRYKKVDPSARSPSQTGPRVNRGPGIDNFEPRNDSNAFPNKANEGQAEFRRR